MPHHGLRRRLDEPRVVTTHSSHAENAIPRRSLLEQALQQGVTAIRDVGGKYT